MHYYYDLVHYKGAVWVLWFLYTFPTTLGHLVRSGRLCDPRVYCVILVFGLVFSFKFDCCKIVISSSFNYYLYLIWLLAFGSTLSKFAYNWKSTLYIY
ncbi:unnamed protein product [Aphis gossypii]|uniref:Uncharacterized protein n=1 Tax=Aphis gossypii TaxID=80765 RepID=A0A9P0JAR4_APHGO|nr:unnamed protein product [Aphis gossypii]